jgi:hypothetical protein
VSSVTPLPDRAALTGGKFDNVDHAGMHLRDWMGFVKDNIDAAVADIDDEATRALAAEALLQSAIDALIAGGASAQAIIDAVAAEAALRTSGDAASSTAISGEATSRAAADTSEASTRATADAANASAIASEAARAEGPESTLSTAISTEATARAGGDSTNEAAIAQEISDRATAVTANPDSRPTRAVRRSAMARPRGPRSPTSESTCRSSRAQAHGRSPQARTGASSKRSPRAAAARAANVARPRHSETVAAADPLAVHAASASTPPSSARPKRSRSARPVPAGRARLWTRRSASTAAMAATAPSDRTSR